MPFLSDTVFCFDLDDTLYKEIDFLKSAYKEISMAVGHPEAAERMLEWYYAKENAFKKMIETYGLSISVSDCIKIYRNHFPDISLNSGVKDFLIELKKENAKLGLISDGRSITQRNKIKALGLDGLFDIEIISEEFGSEKPNPKNYQRVMDTFPERKKLVYVGDNTSKDFIAPNQLGWFTVCLLDDGNNIHKQVFEKPIEYLPQKQIMCLNELNSLYNGSIKR